MTTNFQFKSSLIDYTYEGQGYSYTITPNDWTTIDVDQIAFGQFVSLMSDVYSGAILALNRQKLLDKFEISLSAPVTSGGSGQTGDRYVGEWDLNSGGNTTLVEAFPDPTKSTGYLTISNDIFQYVGDNSPIPLGSNFYDYVQAEGVSPVNSGIRSMKINISNSLANGSSLFYGIVDNSHTLQDLIQIIASGSSSTASGYLLFSIFDVVQNFIVHVYTYNNGVIDGANSSGVRILNTQDGEPIYIDLNTTTGELSISVTGIPNRIEQVNPETGLFFPSTGNTFTVTSVLDLTNFTTATFAPFFGYSFDTINQNIPISSLTFDLGTTDDERLPFLSALQAIEPPINAADGQVYKVVGNGTYLDNPPLADNDYVEFTENLQNLIITRPSKTDAQLNNFVLAKIDDQLQPSGLINTAIKDSIAFVEQLLPIVDGGNVTISATATFVELSGNVGSFANIYLPGAINQQVGKRIIVVSGTTGSSSVSINTAGSTLQGLPAVTNAVAGTIFEFVLRTYYTNTPIWVRIK